MFALLTTAQLLLHLLEGVTGFMLHSSYHCYTLCTASRVNSLIPKFLLHRESLKEIGPELKHIFVRHTVFARYMPRVMFIP